ncbi:MAG: SIMPL domain-containing protein [Bryobacterales bacterium]|nr:SIMPL domain-containing protein [Bryobacterales bacterium]
MLRKQSIVMTLAAAGILGLGLGAGAQTVESTPTGTRISASSEAVITVKPDQAQISMAVVTQAATSQEAGTRNAQETEKLLTALKQALGTGGEYKTSGYWVNPQYSNSRDNNRVTQYVARNSVAVTIDDLKIVSRVIDAAIRAGANNISALRFSLKDEEASKTAALVQATSSARDKAAAMAKALGLRVRRVVSVADAEIPSVTPLMMEARMAMADTAAAQTPVEPGMIEVRSRVTVTVEAN